MKTELTSKIEKTIDIVGIVLVLFIFLLWRKSDSNVNVAGTILAFLSVVLFLIICVRFVRSWLGQWEGNDYRKNEMGINGFVSAEQCTRVFAIFFVYDVIIIIAIHVIRVVAFHDTTSLLQGLNLFLHIDTGYYLKIAEQWYVNSEEYIYDLVFYPGYPVLIRLANTVIGNYLLSATIVSGVFYALGAVALYKLLVLDFSKTDAVRGLKYFSILPATFFFATPMSESLFVFLSIQAIYLARTDRWGGGCVFGALSAFTRSLGVLALVPLAYIAITGIVKQKQERKQYISRLLFTLIIPIGTIAYLFINYSVAGDAFAFSTLEYDKWGQSMGLFFDTVAFQIDNGLADIQQPYYTNALGIWFPNVAYIFATLLLMVFATDKIRTEYAIWFICYFVLAIGATYLISAPRYLVACLPIYPAIVAITKNRRIDKILTCAIVPFSLYYLFAFAARWEVF